MFSRAARIRYILSGLPLVLLAGCVTTTDPVPMGPDTYMVSTHQQGGRASSGALMSHSAAKANEFCSSMGKQMVPDNFQSQNNFFFATADNTFIFRCYAANDPRDQEPNLRQTPSAVIQVQQQ